MWKVQGTGSSTSDNEIWISPFYAPFVELDSCKFCTLACGQYGQHCNYEMNSAFLHIQIYGKNNINTFYSHLCSKGKSTPVLLQSEEIRIIYTHLPRVKSGLLQDREIQIDRISSNVF